MRMNALRAGLRAHVARMGLALVMFGVLPAAAEERAWTLDTAASRVGFVIKQMNVPVEGGFKRFSVSARFDPARPEQGRFSIEIDVASIDTGSSEGDGEARRPAWFDVARYPRVQFVSQGAQRLADGRLMLSGDLAIKGKTRRVAIPVTLTRQARGWLASGAFPLRRADFGIGGGDWNDVVDDQAEARFRLLLVP